MSHRTLLAAALAHSFRCNPGPDGHLGELDACPDSPTPGLNDISGHVLADCGPTTSIP